MVYDAVVVGLGGVGSFALRALKGKNVLGLERFRVNQHTCGSSHGYTRIYRRAYFEHSSYVPWIVYSLEQFRRLRGIDDNALIMQECGSLLMQQQQQQGRMPPLLQSSWDSAEKHGVPVEFISAKDLPRRFPQFEYYQDENEFVGLLEPGGGFLRPERIQEAALKEARDSPSVSVLENTKLLSFQEHMGSSPSSTVIELKIQREDEEVEVIQTRKLLLSMGAWSKDMIPSWSRHLRVIRQLQGWIDVSQVDHLPSFTSTSYGYENMPAWVMDTPRWPKPLYGVPCDTDDPERTHWLKIGIHGRDVLVDDLSANPVDASVDESEELAQAAAHGLDRRIFTHPSFSFLDIRPCLYTMSDDTDFMIGVPEGYKNVFAVGGLSGHGFKMTPALGQMMGDFCDDADLSRWNLEFCSPTRFET